MKIIILTGKFGMGHFSAASSLAQQIKGVNPEAELLLYDIFDYAMPGYSDRLYRMFSVVVTRASHLYNRYYNNLEKKGPDLKPKCQRFFLKKLKELLEQEQPNVFLSTLPFCSQLVSRLKALYGCRIPLITCITDISSHSEWINQNTDLYLVPSKSVRIQMMEKGVEEEKLYVYGIPVRPEFDMDKHGQDNDSKEKRLKHILIMGGGLGVLPDSEEFYEELNENTNFIVTVITGKNREIYQKLHGRYSRIRVIGYTDQVYQYMKEADAVISKPGGITLFETIYAETPLLVFEPFLQQEINNSGFIVKNGIGMVLEKNPQVCLAEICQIVENESLLELLTNNVKQLKFEYDRNLLEQVLQVIGISDGIREGGEVPV